MKYAVLGAGAIGGAIAAYLSKAGQEVWLIDPMEAHTRAIQDNGLTIEVAKVHFGPVDEVMVVHPHAILTPEAAEKVDVIFLAIKGCYTRSAIDSLKSLVKESTVIVTAQNGIGSEEILAEHFNPAHIAYGVVNIGGRMVSPGQLECNIPTTTGEQTGHLPMSCADPDTMRVLKQICLEVNGGQFVFKAVEKEALDKQRWSKLMINAVVNSIGAVTEGCMDSQQSLQSGVDYGEKIIAEGLAVAKKYGVKLNRKEIHLPNEIRPKKTEGYRHYSSMCMDVVAHRNTENEFINGAIVRGGRRYGIETPYNQAIYWLIDIIENTYEDRYSVYQSREK